MHVRNPSASMPDWQHARTLCGGILMVLVACLAAGAAAQTYPSRPIRIVTSQPGSGSDFVARLIAPGLSAALGQAVVVDNRGLIAIEIVARAPPDGHTVIFYSTPLWLSPFLRSNVSWDPVRDFAPITLAVTTPNILAVHPSVAARSVAELIAYAKAHPGKLNYGSGSIGSSSHLAAELFKALARVDIVRIPYKGVGPALIGLIAGQVHIVFPSASSALQYVKAGSLRALAVSSAQPSALAPGLPTIAASGVPGYEASTPLGVFAPAGTPAPIVERLNREMTLILNRPDVRDRLFASGVEVVGSTPAQLAEKIRSEMTRLGKVIREAGIRE
jgi:tripartite-type tricarboxylate transporter receptor subunit TctC